MEKPNFEDGLLIKLSQIVVALESLGKQGYEPFTDIRQELKDQEDAEKVQEQLDLLHRQNKILTRTVIVAVVGIIVTAVVGILDLAIRLIESGLVHWK